MRAVALFAVLLSPLAQAMQALDDSALSDVSGRDGITLETTTGTWSASAIRYQEDGQSLDLKGVSNQARTGATSTSTTQVDVTDGRLQVQHQGGARVMNVNSVEMGGSPRSFGGLRAFYTLGGVLKLKGGGASGVTGISVDDSRLSLSDVTFYYRDNGYDLVVKGMSLDAYLNNAYLDIVSGGDGQAVKLDLGNSRVVAAIGGIGLDLASGDPTASPVTPEAPDLRGPGADKSFGKLNMDLRLGGTVSVSSGGASGSGLRVRTDVSISNSLFQYQDEGILRAENFSGTLRSLNGLTLDLVQDANGSFVQIAFADLKLNATLGGLILGNPSNQKLGSLGIDLNFVDDGSRRNSIALRPGGDPNSGLSGLTADLSWNMANSAVSLTDNGNSMWFSGLRTYGSGQLTLDITRSCTGGAATGCYAGTQSDMGKGSYNGHFDGLRLGLNNLKGNYSFDGLRVGSPNAPLQGGTELLVLMEIFPAYDFTLNGQITLKPGGLVGDGIGYNADFVVSDARAAITVDETGKGLWLSGTRYDMHFRDGTLDVTYNGVELRKGTYWSNLDVSDLRWGDRASGASLGRLVLKRYEQGSTLALSSGGAGALCVGGSGATASACSASGGRWEDRGNEGVSVKLKNVYVRDATIDSSVNGVATDEKRNQIILETDRVNGVNGSGAQLVVDNFYTSDGNPKDPDANTYGFNADLNLDVAPTKVCTKNGSSCTPVTPDPLGFAVNGRIHFKEVDIDRVQHVHPTGGAVTSMYGVKLQNADIRANLTATPIN